MGRGEKGGESGRGSKGGGANSDAGAVLSEDGLDNSGGGGAGGSNVED
jgi:hypothetical protein